MSGRAPSLRLIGPGLLASTAGGLWLDSANAQIEFDAGTLWPSVADLSGTASADVDGDGLMDVCACERLETVTVYLNRQGGFERSVLQYRPATILDAIQAADLDGDHRQDLLWLQAQDASGSLEIMRNLGNGGYVLVSIPLQDVGTRAVAGDLLGDALPEVVVVRDGWLDVFRNESGDLVLDSQWAVAADYNFGLVLGDMDRDGDTDIALLNVDGRFYQYEGWKIYHSAVHLLLNDGRGGFEAQREIQLPYGSNNRDAWPMALGIGDLDGDSDLDFAVAASDRARRLPNEVVVLESLEGGTRFDLHVVATWGRSKDSAGLALADFDVDGDIDLCAVMDEEESRMFENTGAFVFQESVLSLPSGSDTAAPQVADFNGDGLHDLVLGGQDGLHLLANTTVYDGPTLAHTRLLRGQSAMLIVSGSLPAETVHFVHGLHGAGNSVGVHSLGGITLDLNAPLRLTGSAVADANGVAELQITVPPDAPLAEVVLQAVIRRGPGGADSVKTPFRTAVIAR